MVESNKSIATVLTALAVLFTLGCSTAKKKIPVLSEMEGKKVALVEVDGEAAPRAVAEVALINQLTQRGSFILVSKQDVDRARSAPSQDPRDWKGIAKRAGADYALTCKVLEFSGDIHQGYSEQEEKDSQLAEENGGDGATQRIFKVKSLEGRVRYELKFAHLVDDDTRIAIAEAEEKILEEGKTSAPHLPPKFRFLETLSNKAFKEFFDRYN